MKEAHNLFNILLQTVSIEPNTLKGNGKTMAEKLIQEISIVETDDGYRIEIKGDKERLREMGIGKGMFPFGFGRMGHGPFSHHGPRGFGFPWGHRRGPWWTEADYPTEEKGETRA